MAEVAIKDNPATEASTEADLAALTEDIETDVTEDNVEAVQTEDVTAESIDDEDDTEALALAAIREAAIEEGREQAKRELEAERRRAQDTESKKALKEKFSTIAQSINQDLYDMGIAEVDKRQKIIDHLHAYNLSARDAYMGPFSDAVHELLPAETHDKFDQESNEKPAGEYMRNFLNVMAEHDPVTRKKVLANVTLSDFEGASAKNKAALAERDLDKYRAGRTKGRTDPAGESHGTERSAPQTGPGKFRTKTEARAMRVRDEIDNTVLRTALANPNLPD